MIPTIEHITQYLAPLRPHLLRDGGDIEPVRLSPDGKVLYIRLLGNCRTCDLHPTTIRLGILEPLRRFFPTIEAVEIIHE